ncbi:hypothetical protein ACFXPW_11925 [Streptomyces goshikiensis]|uniref:hypothetical protein n=1 Tax=Streptomyces goshikiensis TaxID=1942 RepID=UPI0036C4D2EE
MDQAPLDASASRDVFGIDGAAARCPGVAEPAEPSADLLDRALAGWERFLSTLKGATDG